MQRQELKTETLCLSVAEAATETGLSKSLIYDMIKVDRFPHVHFGPKRVVVPVEALRDYLRNQTEGMK